MTTKAELVDQMADASGISRAQAVKALEALIAVTSNDLKKEGRFALAGLGTFTVGRRAARTGRNPANGEPIKIKATNTVKFRAAPDLKEAAGKFKVKTAK